MATPVKISDNFTKVSTDSKEEELMSEVLLLLENLAQREEVTVKFILDRLYDVASLNLIDGRFRSRSLKKILRWIAIMSKPAFRVFAWRWFKRNCPLLITRWLYEQVSFKKAVIAPAQVVMENQLPPGNTVAELEYKNREIKILRSQVKLLTGILIGVIAIFSGSLIWLSQNLIAGRSQQLHTVEKLPPVTIQEATTINRKR
jgi:hypothetical protein